MEQFIYQLHPRRLEMLTQGPTEAEARALQEHVEYLEQLARAGTVLLAGRTQTSDESTFGLVLLSSASESAARDLMTEDPAVKNGVMTAQLFPYRVAVLSDAILEDRDG